MSRRDYRRVATIDELKALAHPIRVRILRMCYGAPKTNQELATRYGWIPFNPARLAEPPSGKGKRLTARWARPASVAGLQVHAPEDVHEVAIGGLALPVVLNKGLNAGGELFLLVDR